MGTIQTVPRPTAAEGFEGVLKYQNECVRTNQYEYLGRCKKIVLEAEAGARTQGRAVTDREGHCLEWYNQNHPKGGTIANYLPIAQTQDRRMLLCLEPVLKRDLLGRLIPGAVGLMDKPDPNWKPRTFASTTAYEEYAAQAAKEGLRPEDPTMISQELNQLSDKIIQGSGILVFQPVVQVLFQPEINLELQATYWTLKFDYDSASQTHPAFLVDRATGEAHFFGGKYQIVPVG